MPTTWTKIASVTTTGSANYITFTDIPSTFTDLMLMGRTGATSNSGGYSQKILFNGGATANYNTQLFYATGTSPINPVQDLTATNWYLDWAVITNTTLQNVVMCHIFNYANTSMFKSSVQRQGRGLGSGPGSEVLTNSWESTAAVNSIQIRIFPTGDNWKNGSVMSLYGIKRA